MTRLFFITTILFLFIAKGFCQEHEHSHDATADTDKVLSTAKVAIENVSDKYEVLVKWQHVHPNEVSELELYLSDYVTNAPIEGAKIQVNVKEDPSIKLTVDSHGNGLYHIDGTFPKAQKYTLNIAIDGSKGPDIIQVAFIDVVPEEDEVESTTHHPFYNSTWFLLLAGILVGMLLMWVLGRSKNKSRSINIFIVFVICIGIPFPLAKINAHGDHDGNTKAPTSNMFLIPKETQFLFDIFTAKIGDANFSDAIKLFGTIVPSSYGKAEVSAPITGRITTLKVAVGQKVIAGQVLAIVEQYLDANTQVSISAKRSNDLLVQTERNSLAAELEAATKDYERLKKIADIAAKKEIDEATSRYNKAKQNLELYNKANEASTNVIDKYVTLRSPITGLVDQFTISKGATVNQGQSLFNITNLSKVYVETQVYDKDIDKINIVHKYAVECTNSDHKSDNVKLISKAQSINPTNQSQKFIFELSNPNGDFKIGEFVNVLAFSDSKKIALAVPNSALNELNGKPILFIKNKAEQYEVVYLSLGENNGSSTVVLKGLHNNERVVVNGTYQMKMMFLNQ